ncbi:MAG TPA: tRNA pseudouridine(13) synthase TruD [Gammaproteobacteria bacterium]|nr:tRNA pseudouridine(13) synthase TruD [Gammaproteobacteria bacterium]
MISRPARDWPRAGGEPPATARVRALAADFRVIELPLFEPDGSGQHVLLRVRKTGVNTDWLAGRLAALAGVARHAVGYAGRKDRHAVAEQWFSIDLAGRPEPDWRTLDLAGVEILEAVRHGRKLKTGALRGNRFELTLRELRGDVRGCRERVERICREGVPNYFGPQRFGRRGDNVAQASAMFAGRLRVRGRGRRGILLSAARAAIFNAVLAERVRRGDWNRPCPGDVLQLDGSRSWFVLDGGEDREAACRRCAEGDLHPTGPLWGRGDPPALEDIGRLERELAEGFPELVAGLTKTGMAHARRSLRLPVREVKWETGCEGARLGFTLPPGGYATVVLRELVGAPAAGAGPAGEPG